MFPSTVGAGFPQQQPCLGAPVVNYLLAFFSPFLSSMYSFVSSIFLEIQVRIDDELDIYLLSFMGSMVEIYAYLSILFYNSGEL